jgi:hypothetical protein
MKKLIFTSPTQFIVVDETAEIKANQKYLTSDKRVVNWHQEFADNIHPKDSPPPIISSNFPIEDIPTCLTSVEEVKDMIEKKKLWDYLDEIYEDYVNDPTLYPDVQQSKKDWSAGYKADKNEFTREDMINFGNFCIDQEGYTTIEQDFNRWESLQLPSPVEVEMTKDKTKIITIK